MYILRLYNQLSYSDYSETSNLKLQDGLTLRTGPTKFASFRILLLATIIEEIDNWKESKSTDTMQ